MRIRVIIIVLILGIFIVSVSLISALARVNLFGNNEGYRPEQPIAYSHRVHAGEMAIPDDGEHVDVDVIDNGLEQSRESTCNCFKFLVERRFQ